MDNEPSDLNESLWRLKPGASPGAIPIEDLRARPELQLEARLTEALAKIPDAPVASNFNARILAEIDREEARASRSGWRWQWRLHWPRLAMTVALLFCAGLGIQHYEMVSHRTVLAKNVALLAASQPVPSMDALENLDAIQRMSQSTHADGELLADFQ